MGEGRERQYLDENQNKKVLNKLRLKRRENCNVNDVRPSFVMKIYVICCFSVVSVFGDPVISVNNPLSTKSPRVQVSTKRDSC